MIRNYFISKKLSILMAPVMLLLLASCGSYQYAGHDSDGIYDDSRETSEVASEDVQETPNNSNSYYQNLFAEKAAMYDELSQDAIFTDVESYTSADGYDEPYYDESSRDYDQGYAPWGEDPDRYTINIYNNGFFNPYRWGGFYGSRYAFYNNLYWDYYWGDPFFYNYYNMPPYFYGHQPYFGSRFGISLFFGNFYHPYNRFLPGHYYNFNRYYYNPYTYNRGRRGSYSSYSTRDARRSSNYSSRDRNSSYSQRIRSIRNSRSQDYSRTSRSSSRNNESGTYNRTSRRTQSPNVNTSSSRRNSSTTRSSSSNRAPERASSSSRSSRSSSTRSSSGSSRSSGSRSSSTRTSGRGRG